MSFRIKTADTNLPDLQNLAASLSIAMTYATGINWSLPNFQSSSETIGTSTITNATITNLTATNITTTNSFSNSTATTFSATTATATSLELLGGIIVFTGPSTTSVVLPASSDIYSNLSITTVGTTFDVLFVNKTSNSVAINGLTGGTLILSNSSILEQTQRLLKFVVSGVDQITVYG